MKQSELKLVGGECYGEPYIARKHGNALFNGTQCGPELTAGVELAKRIAHRHNEWTRLLGAKDRALEALKVVEMELLHSDCTLACPDHCDYDAGCRCSMCARRSETVLSRMIAELEGVK